MFIAQLGRQPEISHAELEAIYGQSSVVNITSAFSSVDTANFDISILGGTLKSAKVVKTLRRELTDSSSLSATSSFIVKHYLEQWRSHDGKITLGISAYHLDVSPRAVQKIGLILKSSLKKTGVSLRLVPNDEPYLSTATSHNNKLGLSSNKVELIIVKSDDGKIIIAESCGAQNITAYTRRDHGKPKRDAFVGMLPPKLAQIMLNLAVGAAWTDDQTILDPFCGTGTVLQDAMLRGFSVIGSDLSDKMIDYTTENLSWAQAQLRASGRILSISQADAAKAKWQNSDSISAVVCETYLGQPFSAPPSPSKLKEVVGNCNHIISSFLTNIHPQLAAGTPLCIAVPSWQSKEGSFTHLPLIRQIEKLGYKLEQKPLLYYRPDQVVAREILVLKTA